MIVEVANRAVHLRAIERDGNTEVTRDEEILTLPASVDADEIGATYVMGSSS